MHYYKFNIGDYRKDTTHLSTLEHGIYRQLIDWYYLEEKPIPRETDSVMRRLRLGSEDERKSLLLVLQDFFVETQEGYRQPRCDQELAEYQSKSVINKANGKRGGRPKKTQSVSDENPEKTDPVIFGNRNERQLINSLTNKLTKKEKNTTHRNSFPKPDDVEQQLWDDFVILRKEKRAPITPTAMSAMRNQAKIAGIGFDEAIRRTINRNWQAYIAEWDKADKKTETERTMDFLLGRTATAAKPVDPDPWDII